MSKISIEIRGKQPLYKLIFGGDFMPYINCVVSNEMSKNDKEKLKVHLGDLISIFPGKSEEWLFVRFNDGEDLYFKGEYQDRAAIIEVKLFGAQEIKYKDKFTAMVSELFEEELNIPKDRIYVIFYEISDGNWGFNGELF
jgi:phenylpyruvate tautomerase PptA (4-oxalocrotonate tautomerase family)